MAAETVTDLAVAGVILISGLFALMRGLVKELLSIISWAGAIFATLVGFMPLRPYGRDLVPWPLAADIATGATLFFVTLIALSVVSHQVTRLVHGSAAGAVDRTLGFVFGLLRGFLIVVVLFMLSSWAIGPSDQPRWFRNAKAIPVLSAGSEFLLALLPETVTSKFPRIVTPGPAPVPAAGPSGDGPDGREGYRPSERRDMERLIEGTQ